MPKFAAIAIVCLGLMMAPALPGPAWAQTASRVQLVPLAPSEMTAAELANYQALGNDADAQMSFRDTRAFLRLCQSVDAGQIPAANLPNEPKDYSESYLTAAEKKDVSDATVKQMDTIMGYIGQ